MAVLSKKETPSPEWFLEKAGEGGQRCSSQCKQGLFSVNREFFPFPQGQLYLLVTDQGFLTEDKVVWESLHNVDGDGNFCDSEFHLRPPSDPETVYHGQQDQIDQVSVGSFFVLLTLFYSSGVDFSLLPDPFDNFIPLINGAGLRFPKGPPVVSL